MAAIIRRTVIARFMSFGSRPRHFSRSTSHVQLLTFSFYLLLLPAADAGCDACTGGARAAGRPDGCRAGPAAGVEHRDVQILQRRFLQAVKFDEGIPVVVERPMRVVRRIG